MIGNLFCGLVLALSLGVGASPEDLAESYLSALYSQDLETLRAVTSEDLRFIDETAGHLPSGPLRMEGRQSVIEFFRASLATVESSRFEVIRKFTSGDQTVLELVYVVKGDGAIFGAEGTRIELRVPGVTVIRIRDAKVIEHTDFIDYPGMFRQVEEQGKAASVEGPDQNER